jgi:hypothetical protein
MSCSPIGTGTTFKGTLHPISHGIHALVQPLTAAQCLLEFTLHKGGTEADYRASIEKTLGELRRMSDSINYVRELIRIQQDGMDAISFALKPSVKSVIAELQPVLDEASIQVVVAQTDADPAVTMSPMRLRQALFYQFQAAQMLCPPGETLNVSIEATNGAAELRINQLNQCTRQNENAGRQNEAGNSDRISQALHLTEAIVLKAGGEFSFSEAPLQLMTQLPCSSDGAAACDDMCSMTYPAES